jgi:hypothetical protein
VLFFWHTEWSIEAIDEVKPSFVTALCTAHPYSRSAVDVSEATKTFDQCQPVVTLRFSGIWAEYHVSMHDINLRICWLDDHSAAESLGEVT